MTCSWLHLDGLFQNKSGISLLLGKLIFMKTLYFFLLCFCAGSAVAQQVVVANLKENIVYCGVDNPLSALVAGYPYASVVLTVDNGKIEKVNCGGFKYQPIEPGIVRIKVWVKNGKRSKKVGEVPYRAKRLPEPNAMIGVYMGGKISLKTLIDMGGIRAILLGTDFQANFSIVSYTVTALRDQETIFNTDNTGAQYNEITLIIWKIYI